MLDPNGRVATWNRGAQRIKGYEPHEIIGQPYGIFFTEEDRRAGKPGHILSHAVKEGRFQEEAWRVRKDGSRFWASIVVTALRDTQGELRGFAKISRDLTERVKAEEDERRVEEERVARRQAEIHEREVRRSRDELDVILRSIAEGVTVQAADGRLVFVNDAAARLSGFDSAPEMMAASRERILGRFEVLREDGTPFPLDELPGRLALAGRTSKTVIRFRDKRTGHERWSFVSAAPVPDPDGTVELAVSVFREFTERKRTEEAWEFLAAASATLGSSLDHEVTLKQVAKLAVPRIADWCGVEILGPDAVLEQLAVAHVDPAKVALAKEWRVRWPPERASSPYRVLSSGVAELVSDVTDAMIDAAIADPERRRMALDLGIRSVMTVPLIVDRKPFGVLSFVTAESGRHYGNEDLILATEIARRASLAIENARAYTETRAALKLRDDFLSIASHELRTPLSGLSVLVSSLLRVVSQGRLAQLGPKGLEERLSRADRQAKQLARLVDRLLDVDELSSNEMSLELAETDLAEILADVVSRFEDAAAQTGSRIEMQLTRPAVGRWDRNRIDQIVTNLLSNAIKYGGGSPIVASVGPDAPGFVRLTIADGGPGIRAEDQVRVFGQFERAAASSQPGMGLGLWIVNRLVAAHNGTVTLRSAEGEGASFTVVLPVEPSSPSSPPMDGTKNV